MRWTQRFFDTIGHARRKNLIRNNNGEDAVAGQYLQKPDLTQDGQAPYNFLATTNTAVVVVEVVAVDAEPRETKAIR